MKALLRHPLLLVLGLAAAAALAWALRPAPVAVNVGTVTRGPLVVTVDEEARTRIRERYVVSAPVAGRLLRVTLRPGDLVEAGRTVLTAIEPADPGLLDPRSRAQAEARLRAAEATRDRSEPLLDRARTAHAYAKTELDRARDIYQRQGLSHQELDAAEQHEAETASALRSAEFESRIAAYEAEVARAALLVGSDAATPAGSRIELRAPISGRVLRVFQESATVVTPGTRIAELGDPADLEVVVEVLSTDAVKVRPGARVLIEHWGGDASLTARVRVVEPSGFTKVSALGVEEQRVNVRIDIVEPRANWARLGHGYRVIVRIHLWSAPNVLRVPISALFREGNRWATFVARNGRARLILVDVGHMNSEQAEIRAGLAPGDQVVLHPGDKIADQVRIERRGS